MPFWLYLPLFPFKVALSAVCKGKVGLFLPAAIFFALGLLLFPFLLAFGVQRDLRDASARRRAQRWSVSEQASATGEAGITEPNRVP